MDPLPPLSAASAALLARALNLSESLNAELQLSKKNRGATDGKDVDRKPTVMTEVEIKRAEDDSIGFLMEMKRMHATSDYKYIFEDFRVKGFSSD